MSQQNLVTTHLTAEQWAAADQAIATLEQVLGGMVVALTPDARQRVVKMGDGSEAFCRKALDVMAENTGMLPRDLDIEEMRRIPIGKRRCPQHLFDRETGESFVTS